MSEEPEPLTPFQAFDALGRLANFMRVQNGALTTSELAGAQDVIIQAQETIKRQVVLMADGHGYCPCDRVSGVWNIGDEFFCKDCGLEIYMEDDWDD